MEKTKLTTSWMTDPFRMRKETVNSRIQRLEGFIDLWSIYAGLCKLADLAETEKQALPHESLQLDNGSLKENFELIHARLHCVVPQLKIAIYLLEDGTRSLAAQMEQIENLLDAGQYNQAIPTLLDLERGHLRDYERFVEQFQVVIQNHVNNHQFISANLVDMMASELYDAAHNRSESEKIFASADEPMPPLVYFSDELSSAINWQEVQSRLWQKGRVYPLNCLPIHKDVCAKEWRTIRCYYPLSHNLCSELGIDEEISHIISSISSQCGNTPQTTNLLNVWRQSIIAESCATLLAGPAYLSATVEQMATSAAEALSYQTSPEGLPSYLRWRIMQSTLHQCGFASEAVAIERTISAFYGPETFILQTIAGDSNLQNILPQVDRIVSQCLNTPLMTLKGNSLLDFLPRFSTIDQEAAWTLAESMLKTLKLDKAFAETYEISSKNKPVSSTTAENADSTNNTGRSKSAKSDSKTSVRAIIAAARYVFDFAVAQRVPVTSIESCLREHLPQQTASWLNNTEKTRSQKDLSTEGIQRMIKGAYVGTRVRQAQWNRIY